MKFKAFPILHSCVYYNNFESADMRNIIGLPRLQLLARCRLRNNKSGLFSVYIHFHKRQDFTSAEKNPDGFCIPVTYRASHAGLFVRDFVRR